MITPLEIESKEFSKQIRGYNADEVDEFLDLIIEDIEAMQTELIALRAENSELKEQNEDYKRSQINVMNTLDTAKKLMKDISESAEKRAEIIIKNAKLDAEMIIRDAKDSASHYGNESAQLRDRMMQFRARYKKLLRDEIDHLDNKSGDLLSDLEKEFFMPAASIDDSMERYKTRSDLGEEFIPDGYSEEAAASEILRDIKRDSANKSEDTVKTMTDKIQPDKSEADKTNLSKTRLADIIPEHMDTKIGVPKETVALNGKDIEDLIQKTKKEFQSSLEDTEKK